MNLVFYDYPFLFFKANRFYFGFKPFVPIFAGYFLLSVLYLRAFPPHGTAAEDSVWKQLKQQWREKLTTGRKAAVIAYLLLPVLYLFQSVSGGGETFLTQLAENYLHYETLLFFSAFILRLIWSKSPDRLWKQTQMLDRAVQLMVVGSVFATIITRQVDSCVIANLLCFLALGILVFALESCWGKRAPSFPDIENRDMFRPVETYEELLPQQQLIANEVISMICGNCAESSASICVSGQWGVGKTSVVNGAIDELKRRDRADGGKRRDECIYINAMEPDTLSSLFDYFFSRIRDILKKRGAYVGLGSEYQKFISASIGKITDPTVAAFLESRLFPSSDDYRERLKSLEESVYRTLNRDMILVIVDDVERCEEKKARSFVAFIKEIATMRGIVTIFITDFKYLSAPRLPSGESGTEEAEKESGFYYDKFFNYRISVPPIDTEEFMQKKDAEAHREELRNQLGLRPTRDLFLDFKRKLELSDQKYGEKPAKSGQNADSGPQVDKRDRPGSLFNNILGLPRTLSKFYHAFDQILDSLVERYVHEGVLNGDAKAYFKSVCLDELVFFLTFVQACAPNECSRVMERGLEYVEQKDAGVSAHHRLIIALGEDLLYQYSPLMGVLSQSYRQSKAWQFVQASLRGELPSSVKKFDSREEEWFAGIENDDFRLMEERWPDMVSAVTRILSWKAPERGERCLNKLFSFAQEKLAAGEWKLKEVFRVFERQWRNTDTFSQGIPVLKLFWEHFSDDLSSAGPADIKLLREFAPDYLWNCAQSVTSAVCLFIPPDENWTGTQRTISNKAESLLSDNGSESEKLNALLDKLSPSIVDLQLPPVDDAFERLDGLAGNAEKLLIDNHLSGFPDMDNIVRQLRLATEEFRFLEKIKQKAMGADTSKPEDYMKSVDLNEMDRIIAYLQQTLDSREPREIERLQNDLQVFFNRLPPGGIPLSEEQYQSLQDILTRCAEINGRVPMLYRMILSEHWKLGKDGDAPPAGDEPDRP